MRNRKKILCESCKFCRVRIPVSDFKFEFDKVTFACLKDKFSGVEKLAIEECEFYEEDVEEAECVGVRK